LNEVGAPLAGAQSYADTKWVGASPTPTDDLRANPSGVGAPLADGPWEIPIPTKVNLHPSLGDVVGVYKSLTFKVYLEWIKEHHSTRRAKFWQRNYYERYCPR
jgi:hypothetical protein